MISLSFQVSTQVVVRSALFLPFFLPVELKQRAKPAFPSAESSFYPQLVRRVRFDDIALVRVVDDSRSAPKTADLSLGISLRCSRRFLSGTPGCFPQLVAPRPGRIYRANGHTFFVRLVVFFCRSSKCLFLPPPSSCVHSFSRRRPPPPPRRRRRHHTILIAFVSMVFVRVPSFASSFQ